MKIKKVFPLFLIMILIVSASLAETTAIDLGISKEDAISILGDPIELEEQPVSGSFMLVYKDKPLSEFSAGLALMFRSNILIAKVYGLDDNDKQKYDYLGEALTIKYGKPLKNNLDLLSDFFTLSGDNYSKKDLSKAVKAKQIAYKCWTPSDSMVIVLVSFSGSDKKRTMLTYMKPKDQIPEKDYNFDGL